MIERLLCENPVCAPVIEEADQHEMQILYTQIDRDAANQPSFTKHAFLANPQVYFYPASTIKLAGALLALEKLKQLAIEGLNKNAPLRIESAYSGQTALATDQTAPEGIPTIGHFIRKLFVVSDNDAYNRLYEFVGTGVDESRVMGEGLSRSASIAQAAERVIAGGEEAHQSDRILPRRRGVV